MVKTKSGIYQSELINAPYLIHGFSTKKFGDMRDGKMRALFLKTLGIDEASLVRQEQVHEKSIHVVSLEDKGKTVRGVDGLVYKQAGETDVIALSVHTADCVPLLFFDPIERIIGSAHAGWRGTTQHIGKKMIETMVSLGSSVSDIRVVVGPHICGTCYEVDQLRKDIFRNEFQSYPDVVINKNGTTFVDIGNANFRDLLECNIKIEYIDFDQTLCTFDKTNDFYSFRKEEGVLHGEMLGVIGFKN